MQQTTDNLRLATVTTLFTTRINLGTRRRPCSQSEDAPGKAPIFTTLRHTHADVIHLQNDHQ